jgi:hypothetical protein
MMPKIILLILAKKTEDRRQTRQTTVETTYNEKFLQGGTESVGSGSVRWLANTVMNPGPWCRALTRKRMKTNTNGLRSI